MGPAGRKPATKAPAAASRSSGQEAGLTLATLARELASGKIRPVYLLTGAELLLRRQAAEAIEAAVFGDDRTARDFGRHMFAGAEARLEDIVAAASGMPMFGGRRLVVVDGIERLRKGDREALPAALGGLPDSTVVILIADQLDGRLTVTRELRRLGAEIKVDGLPAERLPEWIARRFAEHGHEVSRGAAERLVLLVGPQLSTLAGEIEKTSLYVGEGRPIREDDVNRVVAGGLGGTLEDLLRAVGERDLAPALRDLDAALEAGEDPLKILAFLTYRIADLWRAAEGTRDWLRPEVRQQARNFTPRELGRAMVALHAADRRLKGAGGGPPLPRQRHGDQLVLEGFLMSLLGRRGGGRTASPGSGRRAGSALS